MLMPLSRGQLEPINQSATWRKSEPMGREGVGGDARLISGAITMCGHERAIC